MVQRQQQQQTMIVEHAGTLTGIKAAALTCTSCHFILHSQALAIKTSKSIKPIFLKNVFDKAVEITDFIKSPPLKTHFLTFCVMKGEGLRKHFSHPA